MEKQIRRQIKNPKVLFIVPKFPARSYEGKTMGPDYLAGYLIRELGIKAEDIEILDLDVLPREKLGETLGNTDFDLVCMSFLSFQIDGTMDVAREVDSILKGKGARGKDMYVPIVVGNHGTANCDEIIPLYPYVDAWVKGEGFQAILEITKGVRDGNFLGKMRELEKEPGSKIIEGSKLASEAEINNYVDNYFSPYRKHHYPDYNFEIFKGKKTAQMVTAFGCPGSCIFCSDGMLPPTVRARSLRNIRGELEQLVEEGYEAVYIDDSTFTRNRKRASEIIGILKEFHEKYGLVWAFNTRVDCLDDELIRAISGSGCVYLFCGVESLAPQVVDGMNKVSRAVGKRVFRDYNKGSKNTFGSPVCTGEEYVERAKEVYASMKKHNLTTSVFLIFGGPSKDGNKIGVETFDQAKESIRTAVWKLEPNYISINILRFIPDAAMSNSELYEAIKPVSGKIHAGYFSSQWLKEKSSTLRSDHPIYGAFEAAGDRYPIPPHMTPEYCYKILEELVDQVNEHYRKTGKEITIVVDKEFAKRYLKKENGLYVLAKFEEMTQAVPISADDYGQMKTFTNQFMKGRGKLLPKPPVKPPKGIKMPTRE